MVKRREIRNGKASADAVNTDGTVSEASAWTYTGGVQVAAAPLKKKSMRKSLLKLSKKQKIRKLKKQERGEGTVDRVAAKGVRDAKKINRRLNAKTLW
tara:strand:- start:1044 stop:1337 length:294 start_codon:yes stop_codon:yes gene_type:complete